MGVLHELRKVSRRFEGPETVEILHGVDLAVHEGESVAIVGASGSGKSTLLHIMGALDAPSEGEALFRGRNLAEMTPDETARFRNEELGFVFQFHHLLPEFSAEENVIIPALIAGVGREEALDEARRVLDLVGLGSRRGSGVSTLSGGERQRVAIARAVIRHPRVLLADEPTGSLDAATGAQVGGLLARLNAELGMTLVVVTHNQELAASMGRVLELGAGILHEK